MPFLPGVSQAKKKDGTVYYRSSVTFHTKHISLGSFPAEMPAHQAYLEARRILESETPLSPDDYQADRYPTLPFGKWISLINFKNNGFYIKTPIYLHRHFFHYYLSPTDVLTFDADDLFYYSNHSIMRRGNHLFVAEYGMQTNIHSRYGIKNFARLGIDYRFVNGDTNDYRYSNIEILNPYHGVTCAKNRTKDKYVSRIHIRGDYLIGKYPTAIEAAVAYNKAVDLLKEKGITKQFEKNYIEELNRKDYLALYDKIEIAEKIINFTT